MRALLFLLAIPLFAVDGVVVNQTTGKPQSNVTVTLVQPGQNGMQSLGSTKTDSQGKFKIEKETGESPALLQALYGGVTYTKMLQPGASTSGLEIGVFDSTSKAGTAELNQHMVLLQPSATGLQVGEMYLLRNTTKTTYNDPSAGTLRFYLPAGHSEVRVTVSAPGGMPVQRAAEPAGTNTFKVNYPIKPGETRFDINYTTDSKEIAGKTLLKGGETRLVVPNGVTIEGEGLEQLGTEPQTQAKIYGIKGAAYSVKVSGSGSLALEGGGEKQQGSEEDNGQPQIQQTNPRIYDRLWLVLGLSFTVLALGFVVLYRSSKA